MNRQSWKVVITDCDHGDAEEEKKLFDRIGAELVLAQVKEEEDLIRVCKDADGIVNQYSLMTRRVLEALPRCKAIARYGVGVDSIDLRAATDLGIVVANVPDYCVDEVALQAVTLLMALIRQTVLFDQKIKSGHWDFRDGDAYPPDSGKNHGTCRMRKDRHGSGQDRFRPGDEGHCLRSLPPESGRSGRIGGSRYPPQGIGFYLHPLSR